MKFSNNKLRKRYDEKLGEKQNWYIIFIIDISGDCSESFQFLISGRPSAVSLEVILLYFICHRFLPSLLNFFFCLIDCPLFLPDSLWPPAPCVEKISVWPGGTYPPPSYASVWCASICFKLLNTSRRFGVHAQRYCR